MKKTIKITLTTVAAIIVLLVAAIIIIPLFFQKQLVDVVLKEANKMLYADIAIEDFHLTLLKDFPNPTLRMENVLVKNKVNFDGDTLAKLGKFDACIDLKSILSGDYRVKKLEIEDALINVKFAEDGKFNMDIMIPDSLQVEDTAVSEPFHINIKTDKISLKNTDIHYCDVPGNMYADVVGLDLLVSGNLSDTLTTINLDLGTKAVSFKMDGVPLLNKTKIAIKTALDADLNNWKFTVGDNDININALKLKLEGWVALPESDIDMDLKIALQNTDFRNLLSLIPAVYAKDFASIKTSGELAFSAFAKGRLTDLNYPAFGAKLNIAKAYFQYPDLPCAVNDININALVSNKGGSLDNTIVDVPTFHFQIMQNPFDIHAHIETPMSDMSIDVGAKGMLNLADVKKMYPFDETTDINGIFNIDVALKGLMSYLDNEQYDKFDAKGTMEITDLVLKNTDMFDKDILINKAMLAFSSKYADLQTLNIAIGQNDLAVSGKVENYIPFIFSDSVILKANVNVNSNYLNVGDLMSQPIAASDESSNANETAENQNNSNNEQTESSMEIIEVPNWINANAKLNVKKLIYDNIELNNAGLDVVVKDNRLIINNLSANLFQGNIKVSGLYETLQPKTANTKIDIAVTKISPKELVQTFGLFEKYMPILKHAEGLVSLNLKGDTKMLNTMSLDYNEINLIGKLGLIDFRLQDVEPLKKVAEVMKWDKLKSFSLKDINVNFEIINGLLQTNPFNFNIDKTKFNVDKGTIGLDKSLNYNTLTEIPKSYLGAKANEVLNKLNEQAKKYGVPVNESDVIKANLKIGGTIDHPTFDLGLSDIKEQVVDIVKEKVEEVKEKVKEEVKTQVNNALDEAQKKADALIAAAQKQKEALVAAAKKQADDLVKAEKQAGEKALAEAQKQADDLVAKASNPIAKKAAEASAKKIMDEAKAKADKANAETKVKADKLVSEANAQGDKLVADAKAQGDKLIEEARKKNN